MKVKKLLIGLLVSGLALSFTGCGDKVVNDKGEKVQSFGQFIEINKTPIASSDGYVFNQYFVYDKTTKIFKKTRYFCNYFDSWLDCWKCLA